MSTYEILPLVRFVTLTYQKGKRPHNKSPVPSARLVRVATT